MISVSGPGRRWRGRKSVRVRRGDVSLKHSLGCWIVVVYENEGCCGARREEKNQYADDGKKSSERPTIVTECASGEGFAKRGDVRMLDSVPGLDRPEGRLVGQPETLSDSKMLSHRYPHFALAKMRSPSIRLRTTTVPSSLWVALYTKLLKPMNHFLLSLSVDSKGTREW